MKCIITVLGSDKVGIIAKICTYLAEKEINVLDISQTIIKGYFNMMMIVEITKELQTTKEIQGKLADIYTSMNASKSYVYNVAQACDRNETTRKDSAGAILYAAEKSTEIALQAIQILGGNGYTNDYPVGRLLRDSKLYEIGAGTSEIRRMLIGREVFNETT